MNRYIHLFDTASEMNTARADWGGAYSEPWLAASKDSSVVTYNDPEYVEVPSGYKIVRNIWNGNVYNTLEVSSTGEITDSLMYTVAYGNHRANEPGEGERYFPYNGVVYVPTIHSRCTLPAVQVSEK